MEPSLIDGVYQIGSAANMVWFSGHVNAGNGSVGAVLTADIDMSAVEKWVGIGTSTNQYAGSFDGQGHAITGFKQTTTTPYEGLFGYIRAASIKNFSISGTRNVTLSAVGGGGVIGYAYGACTIEDIFSSLNITVTGTKYDHTGGIIGYMNKDGGTGITMQRCTWDGTIDIKPTTTNVNHSVGGLMGYSNGAFTLKDCVVSGTIKTSNTDYGRFGGLVGWMSAGNTIIEVNSCIVALTFTPATEKAQHVGGLFGSAAQGVANVKNCLWAMDYATAVASNIATGSTVSVTNTEKITKANASAGYAAWKVYQLNNETAIRQTLDTDNNPVPISSHEKVNKATSNATDYYYNSTLASMTLTDAADYAADANFTATSLKYNRTLKAGGYHSLCLPFEVTTAMLGEGSKLFELSEVGDDAVTLTETSSVAAGVPCFASVTSDFTFGTRSNVYMVASVTNGTNLKGTFKEVTGGEAVGVYKLDPNGTYFAQTTSTGNAAVIKPFRSYIAGGVSGVKTLNILLSDGTITGLTPALSKEREAAVYDLAGRRVHKATKGIYIMNGKKVMK